MFAEFPCKCKYAMPEYINHIILNRWENSFDVEEFEFCFTEQEIGGIVCYLNSREDFKEFQITIDDGALTAISYYLRSQILDLIMFGATDSIEYLAHILSTVDYQRSHKDYKIA